MERAFVCCSRVFQKKGSLKPFTKPNTLKATPCFLSVSAFQHKPTPTIKPEFLRRICPFQHLPFHQHRILLPRRDHLPLQCRTRFYPTCLTPSTRSSTALTIKRSKRKKNYIYFFFLCLLGLLIFLFYLCYLCNSCLQIKKLLDLGGLKDNFMLRKYL